MKFNYDLEFKNNATNDFWKQNIPLIEYCETLGISVPHYCYHKNLSISGNCRMCLVELKNSPKPIVSCAMNAKSCLANGTVYTNSSLVKKARENVLEFLLLNHPLDCPICDQGGECDLQDQSLFFGLTKKRFYSFKRVVLDKNIGPIVKTVMTRCIHCTRCVRFATEIAGVEDIGMFGRGLQSEIGTYVEKIFQSELSGNVIDLCPVGALTSKPYPFVNRSWELKSVTSIDFSDGFGVPIQLFIKNNQIIKILPGYDRTAYKTNWISDKTRFSFDGMFSPEKIIYSFIDNNKKNSFINVSWQKLFKEFFFTLYFQNHLLKHVYQPHQVTVCLGKNTSLEVLNLVNTLTQRYPFFKLRQSESHNIDVDLEHNYCLNSNLNSSKLLTSNTCLLIGINPRYEGSKLNLKLRSRFLKGNFNIIQIGSLVNLTFSNTNVGSNTNILKSLIEGNNLFCQEFVNSLNPFFISNTELFKRKDSLNLVKMLNLLGKHINLFSQTNNRNHLNILNLDLNDAGFANFANLKTIKNKDFKDSTGIYFINNSFSTSNIKKLVSLRLLNFFQDYGHNAKILITQSSNLDVKLTAQLRRSFNLNNHLHLPNTVFFETSGTYINTEGNINKVTKVIAAQKQTKSDWQVIRKILSYSKKMLFVTNFVKKNKIVFNSNSVYNFKNYIGFQYYAVSNLNNLAFRLLKKIAKCHIETSKFKPKRKRFYNSQLRFWLNDFFIDGKDFNSKYSSTMIQCSKLSRLNNTNFKF
uniref:Complex I-75kD n=1 Tax=Thalassiosira profunda TaxID=376140 RepID=A0A7T3RAN7_9STRA|nr:NADH dehydrogenase subunit 11 [Thalassiosira profunda]QPZ94107.1 NADH dehydrogenase subunit 11 [Thalassiosira profunda]